MTLSIRAGSWPGITSYELLLPYYPRAPLSSAPLHVAAAHGWLTSDTRRLAYQSRRSPVRSGVEAQFRLLNRKLPVIKVKEVRFECDRD